jgi:hypothetical protein
MLFALVTRSRMRGRHFAKKVSIDSSTSLPELVRDRRNGSSSNNGVLSGQIVGNHGRVPKCHGRAGGWENMKQYRQFC